MTLQELGMEYYRTADALLLKVKELKTAAESLSPEKRRKLNKRIRSLYEDALNCRYSAKQLLEYADATAAVISENKEV